MSVHKNQRGFTLIESVIYIVLFAIIIGGGMVAAYQIIESSGRVSMKTTIEQEANFILRKIDWALTGVGSGSILINPSEDELTVDVIVFSLDVDGNFLKDGTPLNISSIKVSNLHFEEITGTPKGVEVIFTASDLNGGNSQNFQMTKYAKF